MMMACDHLFSLTLLHTKIVGPPRHPLLAPRVAASSPSSSAMRRASASLVALLVQALALC